MPVRPTSSGASRENSAKRSTPFKPPGPAKRARNGNQAYSSTIGVRPTGSLAGNIGTTPVVEGCAGAVDDDDEFGTAVDLDDVDIATLTTGRISGPRLHSPVRRAASTHAEGQSSIKTSASILEELDEDSDSLPSNVQDLPPNRDTSNGPLARPESVPPGIPAPLLTRIMHESFVGQTTQMSRAANDMVLRYMDTFIREAVARAAASQREKRQKKSGDRAMSIGHDDEVWLDTEDLEEITPGLLLDF